MACLPYLLELRRRAPLRTQNACCSAAFSLRWRIGRLERPHPVILANDLDGQTGAPEIDGFLNLESVRTLNPVPATESADHEKRGSLRDVVFAQGTALHDHLPAFATRPEGKLPVNT